MSNYAGSDQALPRSLWADTAIPAVSAPIADIDTKVDVAIVGALPQALYNNIDTYKCPASTTFSGDDN